MGCAYPTGDLMTELAFHAITDIFPLMDGQPLADLTDDIRQHGLREPIWLYEGKILDGRNRWRACQAAGVEPVFADYQDSDPVGFVVSLNLHRRHLNESQRSIAAAKIWDCKHGGKRTGQESNSTLDNVTEKFNVGKTAVKEAKQVIRNGILELTHKVESGQVRVSTATDIATLPPGQQDIIVGLGEKAIYNYSAPLKSISGDDR